MPHKKLPHRVIRRHGTNHSNWKRSNVKFHAKFSGERGEKLYSLVAAHAEHNNRQEPTNNRNFSPISRIRQTGHITFPLVHLKERRRKCREIKCHHVFPVRHDTARARFDQLWLKTAKTRLFPRWLERCDLSYQWKWSHSRDKAARRALSPRRRVTGPKADSSGYRSPAR